jgi:tRNA A37 threonylcarbamoyltransferase TsaD
MFYFTCFNVEDPHDPSVGLINGQLSLPGNLLRREVFDPVVDQVCKSVQLADSASKVIKLLEEQLARIDQPIHALLLVGGFARNEYLKQRVEVRISTLLTGKMARLPPLIL